MVIALFLVALRALQNSGLLERALEWLAALGPWAPIAFVALYIVSVLLFIPASILTLGAGIVFGLVEGGFYVFVGAFVAATLCFIVARHLARDWMARLLEGHPRFKALDEATARDGWKIVALVRLAPIFPFSLTSYAFGLTRVPLWQYVAASTAMIPGTLLYVYLGTLVGDVTGIRQGVALPPWLKWLIGGVTFLVTIYVTRFARKALRARID